MCSAAGACSGPPVAALARLGVNSTVDGPSGPGELEARRSSSTRIVARHSTREASPMAFPDAPRVLYEINPLDEVVCQLKFPPVLRIDAEMPVGFQEAIRAQFPLYRAEPTASRNLPQGSAPSG